LRFFSPPENPVVDRSAEERRVHVESRHVLLGLFQEVGGGDLGQAHASRAGVDRGAQEVHVADAGDLHRVLERQEHPARRGLRARAQQVLAVEVDRAAVTS
jgi:hypothetical protein